MLFLNSCEDKNTSIDINKLNGYWEIVQAQNPYGKSVVYSINTQIDYFEIEDSLGFRKKMKPDLNGNYTTSKALEKFTLYTENDSLKLDYTTPYDSWTEVILELNDSLMLVINQNDFLYTYKKFEPINITP
jgi:hypothetical protein